MADVASMVSEYYGADLTATIDLKTTACCNLDETTADHVALLRNVHADVLARFFGCGSPIPTLLAGKTVLDLGCGTGRDVYIAAQLVGSCGRVIGIDMTKEQIDVAKGLEGWHAAKFGYPTTNTRFSLGCIDNLKTSGIEDGTVDVVISNCVINLCSDKEAVFREIWRVLRPGGELYFSDMFADRRVPLAAKTDKMLWGEGLAGALYRKDFARTMAAVGFAAYWVCTSREIEIMDPSIRAIVDGVRYYSETIRSIKVAELEDTAENYGDAVIYNGSIPGMPHAFQMGSGVTCITDMATSVDANTKAALEASRYASHFRFRTPTPRVHLGPMAGTAAASLTQVGSATAPAAASCCAPTSGSKSCC